MIAVSWLLHRHARDECSGCAARLRKADGTKWIRSRTARGDTNHRIKRANSESVLAGK